MNSTGQNTGEKNEPLPTWSNRKWAIRSMLAGGAAALLTIFSGAVPASVASDEALIPWRWLGIFLSCCGMLLIPALLVVRENRRTSGDTSQQS